MTESQTEPAPPVKEEDLTIEVRELVRDGTLKVKEAIESGDATEALRIIADRKTAIVRAAIIATQPRGWATVSKPLVESLNDDQAAGVLAALLAVFVQR